MPPLRKDPGELALYQDILKEWRATGFIQWTQRAAEWLRDNLVDRNQRSIGKLMYEHRDEVDQTRETRAEYCHLFSYHYDFRIPIDGQRIYIETVLVRGIRESDSVIRVVNIKPA